jgi:hypothetical protein
MLRSIDSVLQRALPISSGGQPFDSRHVSAEQHGSSLINLHSMVDSNLRVGPYSIATTIKCVQA